MFFFKKSLCFCRKEHNRVLFIIVQKTNALIKRSLTQNIREDDNLCIDHNLFQTRI